MHIGDNIVKFKYNDDGLCLSKPDTIFLGKWPKRKKEYYWRIKKVANRGGKKRFYRMLLQESISDKKDLSYGRSGNFSKFEHDDKLEHH